MGFEGPDHLEGLRKYADMAITAAQENIIRSGAKAAELVTLAMSI